MNKDIKTCVCSECKYSAGNHPNNRTYCNLNGEVVFKNKPCVVGKKK